MKLDYILAKLSDLNSEQINELIVLHKQSIPNSFFSIQPNKLCKKIYESISSNESFFNIVAISNNSPIGFFVGRVKISTLYNVLSPAEVFSLVWNSLIKLKYRFLLDFLNLLVLSGIKRRYSKKYWVELIYIDKNFRGEGIGKEMLEIYLKFLPKGVEVWVDTQKNNSSAIRFYKKNNFVYKPSIFSKDLLFVHKKI